MHRHVHPKNATSLWQKEAHMRRNNIINKHAFQWIFLCNGIKHMSLDYRYNFFFSHPISNMVRKQKKKKSKLYSSHI